MNIYAVVVVCFVVGGTPIALPRRGVLFLVLRVREKTPPCSRTREPNIKEKKGEEEGEREKLSKRNERSDTGGGGDLPVQWIVADVCFMYVCISYNTTFRYLSIAVQPSHPSDRPFARLGPTLTKQRFRTKAEDTMQPIPVQKLSHPRPPP